MLPSTYKQTQHELKAAHTNAVHSRNRVTTLCNHGDCQPLLLPPATKDTRQAAHHQRHDYDHISAYKCLNIKQ